MASLFQDKIDYITNESGVAVPYEDSSITVGKYGPIVLADFNLIEQLGHFNRERIPERVVHAKGAGAYGYFEVFLFGSFWFIGKIGKKLSVFFFQVTHDITRYTVSKVFEKIGKKTHIAVRFSQVAGNLGSADTVRDPRGKKKLHKNIWLHKRALVNIE